jgi:hypothetical protein
MGEFGGCQNAKAAVKLEVGGVFWKSPSRPRPGINGKILLEFGTSSKLSD